MSLFLSITTASFFDKKNITGILIRLDCYVICDHKAPDVYLRNNPLGFGVGASLFSLSVSAHATPITHDQMFSFSIKNLKKEFD